MQFPSLRACFSPYVAQFFYISPFFFSPLLSFFYLHLMYRNEIFSYFHCLRLFYCHALISPSLISPCLCLDSLSLSLPLCLSYSFPISVMTFSHSFCACLCFCPCACLDGRFPPTGRCVRNPSLHHYSARHRPTSTLSI